MKCESCNEREAKIHYTSIINGVMEEHHLCEVCAAGIQKDIQEHFPLHKLFEGVTVDTKCPNCGLSYEKFRSTGKLGCSRCYDAFGKELSNVIRGIHGHTKHAGKIPKRGYSMVRHQEDIDSLDKELREAVKQEEYEKAAVLRDEIKRIRSIMDSDKRGE